jgi:NodT family efflux transporter outer membrane factor (OMF) lipoprotein
MNRAAPALLIALATPIALGACVREPAHIAPPAVPHAAGFTRAGSLDPVPPVAHWWTTLGDETLTGLIATGLAQAPTLAAAEARLRQARAGTAAARAGTLPALGASALYARARLPDDALGGSNGSLDLYEAGFDAQWELDLWGGKRREIDRARADADAAQARRDDARVALAAEIARTYIGLRQQQATLALIDQRAPLDARLVEQARARLAAGTASREPLEQAQAQSSATTADRARAMAEVAVAGDALAVLTGNAPGTVAELPPGPVPLPPQTVEIGDPAALLARRPDLRLAEARLAAAHAGIGIAEARRLPQVSFLGVLGLGGNSPGDLVDSSTVSTILLPRLSWNVLDFGRSAAAVRGAKAGRDAALADYQATVLAALQDAEAALACYRAARIEAASATDTLAHARTTARLAQLRADAGTFSQSQAIAARMQALAAEAAETGARARLTQAYVALAKALGLGWE